MNLPDLIDMIDLYRDYRDLYIKHVAISRNSDAFGYKCKHEVEIPGVVAEDTRRNWKCDPLVDYINARKTLELLGDLKDIL